MEGGAHSGKPAEPGILALLSYLPFSPLDAQPHATPSLLLAVMLVFCARFGAISDSDRRNRAKLQAAKASRGIARWVHVQLSLQSG